MKDILASDLIMIAYDRYRTGSIIRKFATIFLENDLSIFIHKTTLSKVLFSTRDYGRHHRRLLDDIMVSVSESEVYEDEGRMKWCFSFRHVKQSAREITRAFQNSELTWGQKLGLFQSLIQYKRTIDLLENVKSVNTTKFVSFLSCLTPDSIFCQFFRKRGIASYGIQHGQYASAEFYKTKVPMDVINIENFQADVFLAWGEFIKSSLNSHPHKRIQFSLAGHPKYCEISEISLKKSKFKTCILCLARDYYLEENRTLINIAVRLKSVHNVDIYVKLHPRSNTELYREALSIGGLTLLESAVTLSEGISSIRPDFALVYNSTIYYEFYLSHIVAFRFSLNENDIPLGLQDDFLTFDELVLRIEEFKNINIRDLNIEANQVVNMVCALGTNNYGDILCQ